MGGTAVKVSLIFKYCCKNLKPKHCINCVSDGIVWNKFEYFRHILSALSELRMQTSITSETYIDPEWGEHKAHEQGNNVLKNVETRLELAVV